MDRKINVFIGGSSESLDVAKKVANLLEEGGDVICTIWNKDTFEINDSFLESLIKASLAHDFGLFVASSDDIAVIRKSVEEVPRDNVLFEYGLFLGALGNKRTYLLQEKGCKLPSDLNGYTTPRFEKSFPDDEWKNVTDNILSNMKSRFLKSEIQVLPSTSLAIGYFNSFLARISEHISKVQGSVLNNSKLEHEEVKLNILIPNELSDNIGADAFVYYKSKGYEPDEVGDPDRPFPIKFYKNESDSSLTIIDIPTTLNAIRPSINLIIPDSGLGEDMDKNKIERRELENFKRTLEYLVSQNAYTKAIVNILWM